MTDDAKSPWYVRAFGRDYLSIYARRDEADAMRGVECCIRELSLSAHTRTLDLCCGAARHLKLFAARGVPATGFDLSADLLLAARTEGVKPPLVRGDARALPFADGSFDALVNLFSSFGYFEDERDDAAMLKEAVRVLRPNSAALFDLMNPAYVAANLAPDNEERIEGGVARYRRRIDEQGKRVIKQVRAQFDDGRETSYEESVRLYTQSEFDALLDKSGLTPVRRLGGFDGGAFDEGASPRQIVIARRR